VDDPLNAYEPPKTPTEDLPPKKKKHFTLVELLVVVAIIGLLVSLLIPATRSSRGAALRMSCSNNLKHIGLGLHAYYDEYGGLPPASTPDENGQPMHSWRVLILPFIEQQELYEQYDFDEPWDGPHNRQLADAMPEVYRCPGYQHQKRRESWWAGKEKPLTQYVAVVGGDTIFPPDRNRHWEDVADGTAQTLMVVEVHQAPVHWMSPTDVEFGEFARDLADQSGDKNHVAGSQSVLADGSVHFIPATIDREKVRALSTISGGETVEEF